MFSMIRKFGGKAGGRYWDRTSDPYDVKTAPSPETRANPCKTIHDDRDSCSIGSPIPRADHGRDWERRAKAWLEKTDWKIDEGDDSRAVTLARNYRALRNEMKRLHGKPRCQDAEIHAKRVVPAPSREGKG